MKQIIKVNVKAMRAEAIDFKTDMLAVGLFSDKKKRRCVCSRLNKALGGSIEKIIKLSDFKSKVGETAIVYGNDKIGVKRILLVGLGKEKEADIGILRKASAAAANTAVDMKVKTLAIAFTQQLNKNICLEEAAQAMAEGAYFGSYRYDEFVTGDKDGRKEALNITIIDSDSAVIKAVKKGLAKGAIVGKAQSYARTIANRPGNIITPASMAKEAKKIAKNTKGLSCTVLDEKQLAQKKMGGILAVGNGSANGPRFIVLKYSPEKKPAAKVPTIALVGKAVTFDSGGISLKPPANMDEMKFDKSGGVAVLAAMTAIAELKPSINVFGLIPAVENMPGPTSYRPGDIITTFSGKTVEVQNTDAEGRMILCDAIAYAAKRNCDIIVDIATLTGACAVALGRYHFAGLMGNDDNLIDSLKNAGDESGEKLWHMPSGEEYAELMKSKIADLKNIGGRWGGACTAGAFLSQFADDKKWAHIDMAGMDMFKKTKFTTAGSGGYGVRILSDFVMNVAEKKGI